MGTEIHVELWQLIATVIAWTAAWTGVVFRLTKYLPTEEYESKHRDLERRMYALYDRLEKDVRELQLANARRNGANWREHK